MVSGIFLQNADKQSAGFGVYMYVSNAYYIITDTWLKMTVRCH